jgi:hypothetical protein
MLGLIYKPLLYCYIILCHAEFISAPHMLGQRHASEQSLVYRELNGAGKMNDRSKFHPIHVSTTNIEYNKQDNKLEVICTIFTDDFEAALEKQYKTKTDLIKADVHAAMDALIKKYIGTNLQIKTNDTPVKLNYLGFEINREATDIYLESDKIPDVKKVEAEVSLLHNLFDDQINIVHITVNKVRKSEKLDFPDKKVVQVF